jgi:hypothetical protein
VLLQDSNPSVLHIARALQFKTFYFCVKHNKYFHRVCHHVIVEEESTSVATDNLEPRSGWGVGGGQAAS